MRLYLALLHRWWYLLTVGMWRGQCAMTLWEGRRIKVVGVGKPTKDPGIWSDFRIFWP